MIYTITYNYSVGIEGTYRRTCESVMHVLRRNKDSLMAVLEAFVYDPLLNWRLLDTTTTDKNHRSKTTTTDGNATTGASLANSVDDSCDLLSIQQQNHRLKGQQLTNVVDGKSSVAVGESVVHIPTEVTNMKARLIVDRVQFKLTGNDFNTTEEISVQRQVDLLIQQATNNENLCQCYIGWCPFW